MGVATIAGIAEAGVVGAAETKTVEAATKTMVEANLNLVSPGLSAEVPDTLTSLLETGPDVITIIDTGRAHFSALNRLPVHGRIFTL